MVCCYQIEDWAAPLSSSYLYLRRYLMGTSPIWCLGLTKHEGT